MERLSRLDGLRGLLAVYILICHALPYTTVPGRLAGLFYHGEAIVDLFFALSGLVVIHSLERFNYQFVPFIRGRAWRLLPVYFTVLALAVLLIQIGSPLPAMPWLPPMSNAGQFWLNQTIGGFGWHVLAHALLIQGILPQGVLPWVWITVLGPAWSLSTEWQFYLFMALVVARLRSANRITKFAFLMLAIGVAYRIFAPLLPPFWQFSRAFLPDAAPFFALGLASAVWFRGGNPLVYLICFVVIFAGGCISGTPGKSITPIIWTAVLMAQRYPLMPVLPRLLDSRIAQYLGAISYPLYLVNQPVQRACAMLAAPLSHGSPNLFTWIWLPFALAVPVLAAMVLHAWVERPGIRLGKSVVARVKVNHPVPQPAES